MIVVYILCALLVLMLMILIHELGHYIVGRKLGFKITEFSIGFGKAIWQKTNKRGEKISLRILPLGGYCAFYGEDDGEGDKLPDPHDPKLFNNQKPWKRILVYLAGVTFNFISAIIFAFVLLVSTGYGNAYRVDNVNEHFVISASAENQIASLDKGDLILNIDGQRIDYVWDKTVENMVEAEVGNSYTLTVKKAETGQVFDINVEVQNNIEMFYNTETEIYEIKYDEGGNAVYYTGLGISMTLTSTPVSFLDALWQCFTLAFGFAWLVLKTLWLLITFQLPLSALGGTATVISTVATSMGVDFSVLLVYLPLIAANLAIFNLLPFPALDGGHTLFTTIEWIRGKPINRNIEATIHFIGLILIFAFVIFLDLYHFLG